MKKSQAKKLKAGDRVLWDKPGERIGGTITWKRYNTVKIKWDDGVEQTQYAETMDRVWTQEQLDELAASERIGVRVQKEKYSPPKNTP